MAYYSQDQKKQIQPRIAAILKQNGLKGSLSVRHNSTVTLTITSGPFSFLDGRIEQGWEWVRRNPKTFVCITESERQERDEFVAIVDQLHAIMSEGNHDRSDIQTDYFDVGWYITIQTGKWNKPFIATEV